MRVLMLVYNVINKGTFWRALYLARGLARRGHNITIVATSRDLRWSFRISKDIKAGVTLFESPDLFKGSLRSGWDLYNALSRIIMTHKFEFDLVHAFESRPVVILPALYWQRWRRTPLIMDWSDWFGNGGAVEERPNPLTRAVLRPFETFFEEYFRKCANGSTVINDFLKQRAVSLGVAPEDMLVLPNGCNVEEIYPFPREKARKCLGWPENVFVIGYIGVIFRRDSELMVKAFDQLLQMEPQARLLLIGYCNIPIAKMVRLPQTVWQTGYIAQQDVNLYLAACDLCWLPLRDTGANRGRFPLKLNDYMAAGRPVVVTDVGNIGELVRIGRFGLVVRDEPGAIAQATLQLLREPTLREEMGQKGRRLAETEFTWDRMADKLEQFYSHIWRQKWI